MQQNIKRKEDDVSKKEKSIKDRESDIEAQLLEITKK
jgi:hypothetical protein